MAALTTYDYELCVEICERISNGENIKNILDSDREKYPTFKTFCNWKRDNEELLHLYTRSREDKSEMVDAKIDQTMDDLANGSIDAPTARVIIDTLKWKAGKYYPKMYGDKINHELSGKIQTEQITGMKIE